MVNQVNMTDLDRWSAESLLEFYIVPEDAWLDNSFTNVGKRDAYYKDGERICWVSDWHPSDPKTGQIWLCIEKMREKGWIFSLTFYDDGYVCLFFWMETEIYNETEATSTNPAKAILLAAKPALTKE